MTRRLLVTADDFGLAPGTTRGVLDLARAGVVTSTVLLVNSPHASDAIQQWTAAGRPIELGWHPCLTLDSPLLPPAKLPSLVNADGQFHSLGKLLRKVLLGRVNGDEVTAEFRAQYERFRELVGAPPANVNAHHHVHVFRVIGDALLKVLSGQKPRPFVRRVVETRRTLLGVGGSRVKRGVLNHFGKSAARRQAAAGFPGNDELLGVADPMAVEDVEFFPRWLGASSGEWVELMCHPGHADDALTGRETAADSRRRVTEFARLNDPRFREAVTAAGFELAPAAEV
jgi:predicted glycoside hydrolase/deacetylase ChbG (UPF0249 family)